MFRIVKGMLNINLKTQTIKYHSKLFVIIILIHILHGCSVHHVSQFVPGEKQNRELPLHIENPGFKIVIIYNHGSTYEFRRDPCRPCNVQDIWGTPPVARNLSGEVIDGKTILVYSLCTSIESGDYNGLSRTGELKVVKRSKEIRDKVNEFIDIGIPKHQIFLMGHSAGAWASLLMLRNNPRHVNSVIAFAPAFAGKYKKRNSGWEWVYHQQKEVLASVQTLPALVYAFENDPYNRIDDLVFLDTIPGVVFKPYITSRHPGNTCNNLIFSGHRTDFGICFSKSQKNVIMDYIESRLISY